MDNIVKQILQGKPVRLVLEGNSLEYSRVAQYNLTSQADAIVSYLGTDATDSMILSEIDNLLSDENENRYIDWYGDDVQKQKNDLRSKLLDKVKRQIEMEKYMDADRKSEGDALMHGKKFYVSGATPNVTDTGTDYSMHEGGYFNDPKSAVNKWFMLSAKHPTMISINTNKNEHAKQLLQWVVDNPDFIEHLKTKYNVPYSSDYIINSCKSMLQRPLRIENKYNMPDQVFPFALG